MMKRIPLICLTLLVMALHAMAQSAEIQYLSGTGSDDTVNWQFSVPPAVMPVNGRRSPCPPAGNYKALVNMTTGSQKIVSVEKSAVCINIVFRYLLHGKEKSEHRFEGVMTDATVKVNGVSAGPTHRGAFYAFKYDISALLQYGSSKNLLEVTVAKHSANESVNAAERRADFWLFGGIFRPVLLEALPQQHIEMLKVNAGADGVLHADMQLNTSSATQITMQLYDKDLHKVGGLQTTPVHGASLQLKAKYEGLRLWSAESPTLYTAEFSLRDNNKVIHTIRQRVGFRTITLKQRDGIYVNGVQMKFKGVNRHSFRPESGRTTSRTISIEDVLLIKEMNMNAVRMSHYPPDGHFLDVCDSLGLYVMDELAGWHGNYDTETGTGLVKEMITHDVNHPSVIMWANGNEGGHNKALDHLFPELDPQQRPVVHPWQLFNGIETQHYREYNYGIANYENGKEIVMPTEFLHGQFDGGHGAGLEDYWKRCGTIH
ncbi:glycoside hydrolase family 2 protein [Chitinophaga pinensis]|uniref:glycoside hydrolase family 2 protein n=1 Tax=Chitinophaga pinensis TaxID=79329 RepID=UPI0021BDE4AD|nr:glycoside hydrolase family 2 TIM barrel-domain containing protein [Chitinophaga pinensis]